MNSLAVMERNRAAAGFGPYFLGAWVAIWGYAGNLAWAGSCPADFGNLATRKVSLTFKDLDPSYVAEIREAGEKLDEMLQGLQVEKVSVRGRPDKRTGESKCYEGSFIEMGLTQYPRKDFLPVFVHEYGHEVFYQRFAKKFPALAGRADRSMLMPYNELFADLTTTLYFKDGAAMADAIGYPHHKPFYNRVETDPKILPMVRTKNIDGPRPRDATQKPSFRGWQEEEGRYNFYTAFDPVRGSLWAIIQNKLHKSAKPHEILERYLSATRRHVELRLERLDSLKSSDPKAFEKLEAPENLNQEFFRLLIEEFKEHRMMRTQASNP